MTPIDLVQKTLFEYNFLLIVIGVIGSYLITSRTLPFIIYFSKIKKLTAKINERSSHSNETPNIGGLGIIAGIYIITLFLAFFSQDLNDAKIIIALFIPLMILLFVGFKDDMLGLSANAKLFTEILTASAFILLTDIRIDNFYGLFGIFEINYTASVLFSVFVFIITINAYNLIDGIDGLAGGFAIILLIVLLILCQMNKNYIGTILCISMIGSLIGFLKFNLSSGKRKIFMGDTGSLVIGFLISVLIMNILNYKNDFCSQFQNLPILVLSVLSFPYIDTLRVMFIRKIQGKNFFSPDKNHIHHILINLGKSHISSTILILITYLTTLILCFATSKIDITTQFFITLIYSILSFIFLIFFVKKSK